MDSGASSFCGTPEYLAPEVLNRTGHGRGVDWWSLGALLYEMLTGLPPFYSRDRNTLFERIRKGVLEVPAHLSTEAIDLLGGLLCRAPDKRLGCGPTDAGEIRTHPFFASVDWVALGECRVQPPWAPSVSSSLDTSQFDVEFTSMPLVSPGNSVRGEGGSSLMAANALAAAGGAPAAAHGGAASSSSQTSSSSAAAAGGGGGSVPGAGLPAPFEGFTFVAPSAMPPQPQQQRHGNQQQQQQYFQQQQQHGAMASSHGGGGGPGGAPRAPPPFIVVGQSVIVEDSASQMFNDADAARGGMFITPSHAYAAAAATGAAGGAPGSSSGARCGPGGPSSSCGAPLASASNGQQQQQMSVQQQQMPGTAVRWDAQPAPHPLSPPQQGQQQSPAGSPNPRPQQPGQGQQQQQQQLHFQTRPQHAPPLSPAAAAAAQNIERVQNMIAAQYSRELAALAVQAAAEGLPAIPQELHMQLLHAAHAAAVGQNAPFSMAQLAALSTIIPHGCEPVPLHQQQTAAAATSPAAPSPGNRGPSGGGGGVGNQHQQQSSSSSQRRLPGSSFDTPMSVN